MNKFKALILIGTASLLTAGSFAASPVQAYTSRDARVRQEQQVQHQQEIRRQQEARHQQEIRHQQENQVWVPGHWDNGFLGIGRHWVPGHHA